MGTEHEEAIFEIVHQVERAESAVKDILKGIKKEIDEE